jgi:hypothetical protein
MKLSAFLAVTGLAVFFWGSAINAAPISAAASIEEMQGLAPGGAVQMLSYHAGLNKGGGLFSWDGASNAGVDNCTIFAGKGGPGRWIRQLSGPLDVTMCGAWWDNVHDDAAAVTHAFQVAAAVRRTLSLPGGTGKICSGVTAARGVIVRGQGMASGGIIASSPTTVNGMCMKSGWAFDMLAPNGSAAFEAPKYYDMSINMGSGAGPGGCIRFNSPQGGFTDTAATQNYMMHAHVERVYCELNNNVQNLQVGFQCSKCFESDFSQNEIYYGKHSIQLIGSDMTCIGCAGPNRVILAADSLIRMSAAGTFGNMNRVVANEILSPAEFGQRYDSFIYDNTRSSVIEGNHIEGNIKGVQSIIHLVQGFSHSVVDNDLDVFTAGINPPPHWLVAEGPFVNVRVFNNGVAGVFLSPAYFNGPASQPNYSLGGVRQVITHGGNAGSGDSGFPLAPAL